MFNFDLYNPTRILFGKDRLGELNTLVRSGAKVLITFGMGSAKKSGLIDKVKAELNGREIVEFSGIEPNPKYETLMKAVEIVRKQNIDFILAVGGGSVIDGTKFICLAAYFKDDPVKLVKSGFRPIQPEEVEKMIPFGAVLTLPATGSEMNDGGVISYENGKYPVKSEMVFPQFSILDPTYTYTLPKIQVANGIVDTFVHTTEQYVTYPVDAKLQDRMAEGILQTLIEIGEQAVHESDNYDVRANLMWCATMALNRVLGVGVPQDWTSHMIGHELTAMFGIDHGQTLAIIFPAVLEVRREQKKAKILQYAERVWNIVEGDDDMKIEMAITKTREFFESLGIMTQLSEYGITGEQIPEIVQQLEEHGLVALSETQDITLEISQQILEAAL